MNTVPAGETPPFSVEPFSIAVDATVIEDMRARIRSTRLPGPAPGEPRARGTGQDWLEDLLGYWADGFGWQAAERELNRFAHYRAQAGGATVHFVHERARHGGGIPLIPGHGWPGCFAELLPLVPPLTDPAGHSIGGAAFGVVIPPLPGCGFSSRPPTPGGLAVSLRVQHGCTENRHHSPGPTLYGDIYGCALGLHVAESTGPVVRAMPP